MFHTYEIRPIVEAQNGEITPCLTYPEAREYADEVDGEVFFGLYAQEPDGTWQHIADRVRKEAMLELVEGLFGRSPEWNHKNRIVFQREEQP